MQGHPADEELIQLFQSNETAHTGLKLLIGKYQKVLYHQIVRLVQDRDDTEDILQDIFIKVFEKRRKIAEVKNLQAWLLTVSINQALMFLRKKKRLTLLRLIHDKEKLSNGVASHSLMNAEEIEEKFLAAQLILADRQRVIFNLRYYDEMKFSDIATLLNITEGGCKATYHQAVIKIEKALAT
jgi:RNA polymerase sigma factor (sigma-70 family)